jgi:hypothetical protein
MGIPLPALSIKPPENPLDEYARIAQIKGLFHQKWRKVMAEPVWDGTPEML